MRDASFPTLALRVVARHGTLLKSSATKRQLFEVLARPQLAAPVDPLAVAWLRSFMAAAERITITERIAVRRDPTDDTFLELGVRGGADIIIGGDAGLLVLDPFRGIPIHPPEPFVEAGPGL